MGPDNPMNLLEEFSSGRLALFLVFLPCPQIQQRYGRATDQERCDFPGHERDGESLEDGGKKSHTCPVGNLPWLSIPWSEKLNSKQTRAWEGSVNQFLAAVSRYWTAGLIVWKTEITGSNCQKRRR